MMPSVRNNGSGHNPTRLSSALRVLAKKCRIRIHPKAAKAIFALMLLSWVGLHLTMYSSHLQLIDGTINIAPSAHPMDGTSSSSSDHVDPKQRSREINHDNTMTTQQLTRIALDSSQPYVQKISKKDAIPRRHHLENMQPAFAAVDYLDTTTMMGDDNDDSLDTYYAIDDDAIRGSGYKRWPDGSEPICMTPSFYRLYRPTCNEMHSTVSGHQWLMDQVHIPKHHHQQNHHDYHAQSRYLGAGMYRQVFLLERPFATNNYDEVVFKCMKRFSHENTFEKRTGMLAHNHISSEIFVVHLPSFKNCFVLINHLKHTSQTRHIKTLSSTMT